MRARFVCNLLKVFTNVEVSKYRNIKSMVVSFTLCEGNLIEQNYLSFDE